MRKFFTGLLLAALLGGIAEAQSTVQLSSRTFGGNSGAVIDANGESVTADDTRGLATMYIQTVGTYTGTLQFECSVDGTNYVQVDVTDVSTQSPVASMTTEDVFSAAIAGRKCRVRSTAWTSGSVTVSMLGLFVGGAGSGGGGGGGGEVTNAGTFAVQESGAALTALQLIDNAVSGAGFNITQLGGAAVPLGAGTEATALRVTIATDSTGVLSVDDNGGALTVDGTVTVTDGAGALNVICDSGCSGGSQYTEDAAAATDPVGNAIMLVRDDALSSLVSADGDNVAQRGTTYGAAYVTIAAADGSIPTIASDRTEDAVASGGETGPMVLTVRRDTAASSAGTDGDFATFNTDALGRLWITGSAVEDATETAGGIVNMLGTVRRDTAASSAGTTGDNATLNTDAIGLLWTRSLDPCNGTTKTHIPINISTATTTELTPSLAGASTHYYVCGIDLVTASANNVALVDDDSDGCGSVTSGLAGGTSAASGWNFGANGGLAKGNGDGTVYKTGGTNRVLCLVTSAATQLSGSVQVVAAP